MWISLLQSWRERELSGFEAWILGLVLPVLAAGAFGFVGALLGCVFGLGRTIVEAGAANDGLAQICMVSIVVGLVFGLMSGAFVGCLFHYIVVGMRSYVRRNWGFFGGVLLGVVFACYWIWSSRVLLESLLVFFLSCYLLSNLGAAVWDVGVALLSWPDDPRKA